MISVVKVRIKKLDHFDDSLGLPVYGSSQAAGCDIKACLKGRNSITLKPFERVLIPTGLSMEIPKGFEVQVRPRSGLSLKTGLMVVNSPGTIDSDYRGELKIIMANLSNKDEVIEHGQRVAQLIIAPVHQLDWVETVALSETTRGVGGFGSTGEKELTNRQ